MNPIVVVWQPGEPVIALAQQNNNGDMPAFIHY
jgi:hypothetical protein